MRPFSFPLFTGFPNYGYFPQAPAVPAATTNSAADRANLNIAAAATEYYDYAAAQVIFIFLFSVCLLYVIPTDLFFWFIFLTFPYSHKITLYFLCYCHNFMICFPVSKCFFVCTPHFTVVFEFLFVSCSLS